MTPIDLAILLIFLFLVALYVYGAMLRISQLQRERDTLEKKISDARARIGEAPELNVYNYDHDDVAALNDAIIDTWNILADEDPKK